MVPLIAKRTTGWSPCRVTWGIYCYARVAGPVRTEIQLALDSGADGVIVVHIDNAEHAAEVTALAKFPPYGDCSVGCGRTSSWGNQRLDGSIVRTIVLCDCR